MSIILTALFILSTVSEAQNAETLKIADIKNLIEARNERVAGKSHGVAAMEYRQGFLKRSFLPNLRIYGAQERFQLGDTYRRTQPVYGAEISFNLYNGMKDSLYDDVIDKKKERLNSEKRVTMYQEVVKAKEIYWNLVYLNGMMDVYRDVLAINAGNVKSANRRVRAGLATSADRLQFEIKETEIRRGMDQASMQIKILERELAIVLGFEEGRALRLADKLEHVEGMQDIGSHTEQQHRFLAHPSLIQAEENVLSAKIQKRSWWPRVDAYVARNEYNVRTGNIFDRQEGRETVAGVRLSMNLFDFTSGNREASALTAEAEGSKSEAKYLAKQVENEAHSEITALDYLHRQVHDAEENIKRAQGYFHLTMGEYGRGVKNSPDVLGAVDKVFEVKTKYLEILRDFYITRDHLRSKAEI